ncbi:NAC domain-containing protein 83-like [Rosa chinensis]|uniref:NAC domain-containing protein 83-like n=1 Tax=Rosa chinensis TaxID=74649 RepID=UPI000D0945D8|nr:NAC domain-containing protein 83-like [Rosa chinensis]
MQQQFAVEESRGNDQLPGERFCPMEDELVLFYLKPMLSGEMVPGRNRVVFDCDLYGHQEPWEIWEAYKTRRPNDLRLNKDIYFFTQHKTMSSTDTRIHRTVGNGTWKGDDSGKPVKSLETSRVVGLKKRLTYKNQASEHNGCWILYEFYLDPSLRDKKQKVEDYVLCLLRKNGEPKAKIKKRRKQREEEDVLENNYACDDGDNTNKEQPQAKRQRMGEQNGGLQHFVSEVQSGDDHGMLIPLPEEDFLWEEMLQQMGIGDDHGIPEEDFLWDDILQQIGSN